MEISESAWAKAKAMVATWRSGKDDFGMEELVARAIMEERERAASIAWEYEGCLAEYPDPEAKMFYEGGANDASVRISQAIRSK
jgi:hypothetical protein